MKIDVKFECLEGYYYLYLENNKYSIDTNIKGFYSTSDELNEEDFLDFRKVFSKTNICLWESKYEVSGLSIEDSVKWSVKYTEDSITYSSIGEEGYWPYEYDILIDALMIIDKNIVFFKNNKEDI